MHRAQSCTISTIALPPDARTNSQINNDLSSIGFVSKCIMACATCTICTTPRLHTNVRPRSSLRHNKTMVKSVEGICRNGRVELIEPLAEAEGAHVVVTWFAPAIPVVKQELRLEQPAHAAPRHRLAVMAQEWHHSDAEEYDEVNSFDAECAD